MVSLLGRFGQWRRWREMRAVARRPIADDLWRRTLRRYPFLRRRSLDDQRELKRLASLFLDRKEFTAVGPVRLSNDVVVAIAAQACLPVLHLGLARYDGFVGIVVHADQVVARREVMDDDGIVHAYDEMLSGEAMHGGPLMLSWRDVRGAGRSAADGYNVVIHEFAHVLDMADGVANGVPQLPPELPLQEWLDVMQRELEDLRRRVNAEAAEAAADADNEPEAATVLDPYGAQGIEEFFAVASEAFFVAPIRLRDEHAALYALLRRFYLQDPAAEAA